MAYYPPSTSGGTALPPLRSMLGEYLEETSRTPPPPYTSASTLTPRSSYYQSYSPEPSPGSGYGYRVSPPAVPYGYESARPATSDPQQQLGRFQQQQRAGVACTNCRSAHLACSSGRPCRRCVENGREATCSDPDQPRKRGRPLGPGARAVNAAIAERQSGGIPATSATGGQEPTVPIMILSTSLKCARATEAVVTALGHSKSTLLSLPLSSLIHPDDKTVFARFAQRLLSYPGVISRPVPVDSSILHKAAYNALLSPISGAPTHTQRFRLRNARGSYESVSLEAYLGGGFGAHPGDQESLKLAYVVIKFQIVATESSALVGYPSVGPRSLASNNNSGYYGRLPEY